MALERPAGEAAARKRLVHAARRHLGRHFGGDCSTFVRRVYAEAGVQLPPLEAARTMTESLHRSTHRVGTPQPGDLAYFRRTRRRDRGSKDWDRLTHVAIVEAVDGASVVMIHRASRGVRRLAMNLDRPHDPRANGIVRRRWAGDRRGAPSLSGELFAGFGTALGRGERGARLPSGPGPHPPADIARRSAPRGPAPVLRNYNRPPPPSSP
jgi:hypothetical protein